MKKMKEIKKLLKKADLWLAKLLKIKLAKIKSFSLSNLPRATKYYIVDLVNSHVVRYPTPICLTYAWSFGSLAGLSLAIQMISGLILTMFYTPHIDLAFQSIEFIMRDVKNGWLVRYTHANGASMFFIVVYGHICRGIYYGSYIKPREILWCSGVVLFLLMMATAFTGYVLPWGQMSFWGATVITNMLTAVPVVGLSIAKWIWGGHIIGNLTLKRIYVLHIALPFVIAGFTFIHLALLHKVGSNSPIGSDTGVDDIPFYPYFFIKDVFAFSCYLLVFGILVFYYPNLLNHPDNYIPANPIKTPRHVVPEWYFLPYFTILRSIPYKGMGILAMLGSVLILFTIPFTNSSWVRNTTFRPLFKPCFWSFILVFALMMYVGADCLSDCNILVGRALTLAYYAFFVLSFPLVGRIECILVHYKKKKVCP